MLQNYVITLVRNFFRQREYSWLNLIGLALGMAACIVILLYVVNEFSFDQHHRQRDRIYRIVQYQKEGKPMAWVGGGMATMVRNEFPEFERVASISNLATIVSTITEAPIRFREERLFYAEPDALHIFDFTWVDGKPAGALARAGEALLSQSLAQKYFPDQPAVGQTLRVGKSDVTITGIYENFPATSHLHPDMLISMATFKAEYGFSEADSFSSYWWPFTWTYVLLREGVAVADVNTRFPAIIKKHRQEPEASNFVPALQALSDIHFADFVSEIEASGNRQLVFVFISIAGFLLLLACVNFMNLATARALKRSKEVGVRKVMGAHRRQLVFQFITEALWVSLAAMALAVVLAEVALPFFNNQLTLTLAIPYHYPLLWAALGALLLVAGLLAGAYPSFYLSAFKPVTVLKGSASSRLGGTDVRKILVVFQFSVSITLIICSTVAYWQIDFLRNAQLGFDKEHIVTIDQLGATGMYGALVEKLEQSTAVAAVAGTNARPGMDSGWGPFPFETTGITAQDRLQLKQQLVSYDFFDMLGLSMVAGRTFDKRSGADVGRMYLMRDQFPAYEGRNFIINERAAKLMGKTNEEVLGQPLRMYTEENGLLYSDYRGTIVGVVKDYHSSSLRDEIEPTAYLLGNGNYYGAVLVKLASGPVTERIRALEQVWKEVNPTVPFSYSFLEEDINRQYQAEERLGILVGSFSLMVLLVACMGLFGLSAYTAELKRKEIGIRKTLGASTAGIVRMLSKEFITLVVVALGIALPAGWYASTRWLHSFAYQMDLSAWYFVAAGTTCLGIAWLTVSWQSIKAAMANPIDSLRAE